MSAFAPRPGTLLARRTVLSLLASSYMVARSTVSRYVLSTRAVHLPEHADGGVRDRFRVRE